MMNLKAFREHSDHPIDELLNEVIEVKATRNLLAQFRQLIAANIEAELAASKSKLFDEICESYEKVAIPKGDYGRVTITIDSEFEASLCSSIDELLDQLACLRANSRLWDVKASLVCTQIADFASRRLARLENAIRSNAPRAKPTISPRYVSPHRVPGGHHASA